MVLKSAVLAAPGTPLVETRDLSVNDDMDQASIAHALRELNRLEAFTYVPAFRGRAIRMIRRDLPFDKLEIDFEQIERRKAAEYKNSKRSLALRWVGRAGSGRFSATSAKRTPSVADIATTAGCTGSGFRVQGRGQRTQSEAARQIVCPPRLHGARPGRRAGRRGTARPTTAFSARCESYSAAWHVLRRVSPAAGIASPRCSAARTAPR